MAIPNISSLLNVPAAGVSKKIFTVFVEGNIASGKTTFLSFFQNHPRIKIFAEPVERWRNLNGHNLLDLMYVDPARYGITFQTYALLTRLNLHTNIDNVKPGEIKMIERSVFSGQYCFVQNLHRSCKMPDVDYSVLSEWFDWAVTKFKIHADLIVYLQTRPEVVYERLRVRSRNEEANIPLDYLQSLHELHENWLIKNEFPVPGKVLVIDANDDLPTMMAKYADISERLFNGNTSDEQKHRLAQEHLMSSAS